TSLKNIGLHVQLGHSPGNVCPTRYSGHKDFVVLHMNGIHQVTLDYCACRGLHRHMQLLMAGWWPATPLEPQTCATLHVLRHFQLLNLQGKLTAFDFYQVMELQTDATG
ncbi:hypothetical protein JAAARDRAFT_91545, partial [Jaapia argillacea MUCL 33604]